MINFEIKSNVEMPRFNLQKDLDIIANRIIVPDMQKGIAAGVDIDGTPFPANEPQTVKRKGHDQVLVDDGKLMVAFVVKKKGKYRILITLNAVRKKIGKYLQIDGGRSGKKYKFFGISNDSEKQAMQYMNNRISEAIANA